MALQELPYDNYPDVCPECGTALGRYKRAKEDAIVQFLR